MADLIDLAALITELQSPKQAGGSPPCTVNGGDAAMIYFWVNRDGSWSILNYLAGRGKPMAERVRVQLYDDLPNYRALPPMTHIFSALDQLGPNQLDAVCKVWDRFAAAGNSARQLNNPHNVLRRYELLLRLHESGINRFRSFRADALHLANVFPVFVRADHEHTGNLTGLLRNQRDLKKALRALRVRGYRLRDLLVVEFCDTSDSGGLFRKYSAFKVGDRIIPKYLHASRHWMVKSTGTEIDSTLAREELEYMEQNPHEAQLREIFAIAQIDYGRIDYSLMGDAIQVWEINLNPTLGSAPGRINRPHPEHERALREEARQLAHVRFREAMLALDSLAESENIQIILSPALLRKAKAEAHRHDLGNVMQHLSDKLGSKPCAGPLVRFFSKRLFPRM